MELESNPDTDFYINNIYIENKHSLEIKQINKNICNYIKQFFEFKTEKTVIEEIQSEKCFFYLIPIIDSALNYISNNMFSLSNKISNINDYITNLKYLKIFSNGIYDKILDKRIASEEHYLSKISKDEGMSFYDYEAIKFIQFSKINLSSKDLDTLNIILNNLNTSSAKKK
jgi:hypothetical protein